MNYFIVPLVAAITVCGCSRPTTPVPETIAHRIIVIDRTVRGTSSTNSVTAPRDIAALEALFPQYQTRPESDTAAGYIAQYVFMFQLPDGSSIRVVSDGDGELWSAGSGDFMVVGDLKKTLKSLK